MSLHLPPGYPVPCSKWVERRENCAGCDKHFAFYVAKSNCPNCGELFCSDCLQSLTVLANGRPPSLICSSCASLIASYRKSYQQSDTLNKSEECATSSIKPRVTEEYVEKLVSRSAQLIKENEALQLLAEQNEHKIESLRDAVEQMACNVAAAEKRAEERIAEATSRVENQAQAHALALSEQRSQHQKELQEVLAANRERERKETETASAMDEELHTLNSSVSVLTKQLNAKGSALEEMSRMAQASQRACDDLRQELSMVKQKAADEAQRLSNELTEKYEGRIVELLAQLSAAQAVVDAQHKEDEKDTAPANGRWNRDSIIKPTLYAVERAKVDDVSDPCSLPDRANFLTWGYDVMAAASQIENIVVSVAKEVALEWELFDTREGLTAWLGMAALIEANYQDNPYHNSIHAADVLQGSASLMTMCPGLLASMTRVEKRAVAFAALAHDVRHPGVSYLFLRNTFDPIYFQFNGKSALEQMHISTAFSFLREECADFTEDMTDEEALEFHRIVVEIVSCTDMVMHRNDMKTWGRRAANGDLDFSKSEDRLLVFSLLVHAADIGAQAKGVSVATKWTGAVEEMYNQGDRERVLGLTVPFSNERDRVPLEQGQLFFMETFVIPLYDLVHQLFPAIEVPLQYLRELHLLYQQRLGISQPFPESIVYTSPEAEQRQWEDQMRSREAAVEKAAGKMRAIARSIIQRMRRTTAAAGEEESMNRLVDMADRALLEREEEVATRTCELQEQSRVLVEREKRCKLLSEQLASTATQVRRQQARLQLRETLSRRRSSGGAGGGATGPALLSTSTDAMRLENNWQHAPHRGSLSPLRSALERLNTALSYVP